MLFLVSKNRFLRCFVDHKLKGSMRTWLETTRNPSWRAFDVFAKLMKEKSIKAYKSKHLELVGEIEVHSNGCCTLSTWNYAH